MGSVGYKANIKEILDISLENQVFESLRLVSTTDFTYIIPTDPLDQLGPLGVDKKIVKQIRSHP